MVQRLRSLWIQEARGPCAHPWVVALCGVHWLADFRHSSGLYAEPPVLAAMALGPPKALFCVSMDGLAHAYVPARMVAGCRFPALCIGCCRHSLGEIASSRLAQIPAGSALIHCSSMGGSAFLFAIFSSIPLVLSARKSALRPCSASALSVYHAGHCTPRFGRRDSLSRRSIRCHGFHPRRVAMGPALSRYVGYGCADFDECLGN